MMSLFMLTIILSFLLIYLNTFISFKMSTEREKTSPFECGYDPKSMSRLPFSLHFYLLAVIFLIFDVEITIILPMPVVYSYMSLMNWTTVTSVFVLILVVGAIHEWNEGSLDWVK